MSANDGNSTPASHLRPQKWYGQRVLVLPRSVSAVDQQALPRSRLQRGSLRPSGPSIGNIRSYARATAYAKDLANSARLDDATPLQHDPSGATEISHSEKRLRRRLHYKSYQDLHILSMYQDDSCGVSSNDVDLKSDCTEHSDADEASSIYSDSDTSNSENMSPSPRTPDDDGFPSQALSSTVAFQDSRGAARKNARQVHVIEHRQNESYRFEAEECESVPMRATVLTVPGKPRLIQIHRPQHTDHSCIDTTSTIDSTLPSTPQREKHRISTFSEYSTPASGTPFSDVSRTASEATPTPKLSIRTDLNPLTYRPPASCVNTTYRSMELQFVPSQLADPFGSPLSVDSNTTIGTLFAQEGPPNPVNSSVEGVLSEKLSLHSLYAEEIYEAKIRESITSTMKAFDALAASNFTLQSAEFSYFRAQYLNASTDEVLTTSLRSIFPQASSFSRSTLAAWLVVDLHFKLLFSDLPMRPPPYDIALALSECRVPAYEKASHLRHNPSSTGNFCDQILPTHFEVPITSLRPDCIPSKARSVLGIHTDPAGCKSKSFRYTDRRLSRNNLENQARSVHEGVQTLGQKLVRELLSPSVASDTASRQKSITVTSMRSRGSMSGHQSPSSSTECLEESARALWQACRCIVSTA